MSDATYRIKGGVHITHAKNTENSATVKMPLPSKVTIPMLQHIGAPCSPLVKKGDRVKAGQKIGSSDKPVSAPVHASISGIVTAVKPMLYPGGFEIMSVEIESDNQMILDETIAPIEKAGRDQMLTAIRESGIVGLGGAGFPTVIKLNPPPDKKVDVLVINGAECEPYITSDYREMLENPQGIIEGILIIMEVTGIKNAIIAIESNKQQAIKLLKEKIQGIKGLEVKALRTIYPQGAEKQLIYATTGRKVPSGGLPSDVGVLVQNINTASFLHSYFYTGMPLLKKRITVDGDAVREPKNVEAYIGTSLQEVFDFCGGFKKEPARIIMGGPMMGVAQFSLENTVVKHTNALLAFSEDKVLLSKEMPCLRCGKCVFVCPMGLMPLYINLNAAPETLEEALKQKPGDCIECGCCSYICPSGRHLVQSIRYVKEQARKKAAK